MAATGCASVARAANASSVGDLEHELAEVLAVEELQQRLGEGVEAGHDHFLALRFGNPDLLEQKAKENLKNTQYLFTNSKFLGFPWLLFLQHLALQVVLQLAITALT